MHEPGHAGRLLGPSIEVFVQYNTLDNLEEALEGHDLSDISTCETKLAA